MHSAQCEVKPHFPFLFISWICTFSLCFYIPPQLILPRCFSSGWNSGAAGNVASSQLRCTEINCELALLSGWNFACSLCVWAGFSGFFPLSKNILVGGLVRMSAYVWVVPSVCYPNQTKTVTGDTQRTDFLTETSHLTFIIIYTYINQQMFL